MFMQRNRWIRLSCLFLAVGVFSGCHTSPDVEDYYYQDEESFEKQLGREEMLHQRAILDLKGNAFIPLDTDFKVGYGGGIKGELEVYPNLFLGLELDYVYQEVDENASDVLGQFRSNPNSQAALQAAASLDAEQWMESFERYNILFVFDYDIPFWEDDPHAPVFRFGVGLGAVIITAEEVPSDTFAEPFDARVFSQFLARPSVGLRFPFHDHFSVFTQVSLDLIPSDNMSVSGPLFDSNRTDLDGQVNFSGLNIGVGFAFTW